MATAIIDRQDSGNTSAHGRGPRISRTPPYVVAVGLFVAGVLGGCAASSNDTDLSASASGIVGGDKDDDAVGAASVVALRVGTNGTFELCSGVVLAPNLVLTARHCVTRNLTTSVSCDEEGRSANGAHVAGDQEPGDIGVYVGAAPNFAQRPTAVARAIVAPQGAYLCDSDIALILLDMPLSNVRPLAVRLLTPARPGETIRSIGYGQNDMKAPLGTRFRKSGVPVLAQGKAISASKTPLGPHEFEVGKSICQGDSGGPAISEATGAVIGVVSRGGKCDQDYGHIYTTTAGFEALFEEAFKLAKSTPTHEPEVLAPAGASPGDGIEEAAPTMSSGGCAAARRTDARSTSALALGLAAAAALVLRARRRRGLSHRACARCALMGDRAPRTTVRGPVRRGRPARPACPARIELDGPRAIPENALVCAVSWSSCSLPSSAPSWPGASLRGRGRKGARPRP